MAPWKVVDKSNSLSITDQGAEVKSPNLKRLVEIPCLVLVVRILVNGVREKTMRESRLVWVLNRIV